MAAQQNHHDILVFLIEQGATINHKGPHGETPLIKAVQNANVDSIQALVEGKDGEKADINLADDHGWTPLHIAAQLGHLEVVRLLEDLGADRSLLTDDGSSLVLIAAEQGQQEVVEYLLEGLEVAERNLLVNQTNNKEVSPAMIASHHGHATMVRYLIDRGADAEHKTSQGYSVFMSACEGGSKELISFLKPEYMDTANLTTNGFSCFHIAAKVNDAKVIELLNGGKEDFETQTRDGFTALHIAARLGNDNVFEHLFNKDVDPCIKDRWGWTPMDYLTEFISQRGDKRRHYRHCLDVLWQYVKDWSLKNDRDSLFDDLGIEESKHGGNEYFHELASLCRDSENNSEEDSIRMALEDSRYDPEWKDADVCLSSFLQSLSLSLSIDHFYSFFLFVGKHAASSGRCQGEPEALPDLGRQRVRASPDEQVRRNSPPHRRTERLSWQRALSDQLQHRPFREDSVRLRCESDRQAVWQAANRGILANVRRPLQTERDGR